MSALRGENLFLIPVGKVHEQNFAGFAKLCRI
jgi:hypothetical protein